MTSFFSSPWFGVLWGLVIGFYFYRKSLRLPDIKVLITADHALTWTDKDELPKGVEILFNGHAVPRISRSTVRIWNSGKGCLTEDDISKHDPLKFTLQNGGEFLGAFLLKQTSDSILGNVLINPQNTSEVNLSLDLLNNDEGMVIGLIHTDLAPFPTFKGTLKGINYKILKNSPNRTININRKHKTHIRIITTYLCAFFGAFMLLTSFYTEEIIHLIRTMLKIVDSPIKPVPDLFKIFFGITGLSYLLFSCYFHWTSRASFPKFLIISNKS